MSSLPKPDENAESYETHRAVYHNDFMNSPWVKFMPQGHVGMKNVMFAPLNVDGATVGLIGLANKAGDFTDEDAEMARVLKPGGTIFIADIDLPESFLAGHLPGRNIFAPRILGGPGRSRKPFQQVASKLAISSEKPGWPAESTSSARLFF